MKTVFAGSDDKSSFDDTGILREGVDRYIDGLGNRHCCRSSLVLDLHSKNQVAKKHGLHIFIKVYMP